MNIIEVPPRLLSRLKSVSTPTLCNAIEEAQGKRGFDQYTKQQLFCTDYKHSPIVGYAYTAVVAGNRPSEESKKAKYTRMRLDYFRYMAEGKTPKVAVIEDLDGKDAAGAFWGEVNATIHKKINVEGVLTNGLVRDVASLPRDFPIYAGGVGPSHAYIHVNKIDKVVEIFGLKIKPGDLVHADANGACVVPLNIIDKLESAIVKIQENDSLLLKPLDKMDFNIDKLEDVWKDFEDNRSF